MINRFDFTHFHWIDVTHPTESELIELTAEYKLHAEAVKDCLQPDHLPKFETIDEVQFMIIRYFDSACTSDADTIQQISRKLSIFAGAKFLITIHRLPYEYPVEFSQNKTLSIHELLYKLLYSALKTYEIPMTKLDKDIDFYESRIFLKKRIPDLLKSLYRIKRRIYVIRKLLNLADEVVVKSAPAHRKSTSYQELKDYYTKHDTIAEQLYDNINSLLSIYISISSQRTNEVMRVLTTFSAFFLPLTFLVGVYGMNFRHMPELEYPMAYPLVWGFMVVISLVIYGWFKRKGWI